MAQRDSALTEQRSLDPHSEPVGGGTEGTQCRVREPCAVRPWGGSEAGAPACTLQARPECGCAAEDSHLLGPSIILLSAPLSPGGVPACCLSAHLALKALGGHCQVRPRPLWSQGPLQGPESVLFHKSLPSANGLSLSASLGASCGEARAAGRPPCSPAQPGPHYLTAVCPRLLVCRRGF